MAELVAAIYEPPRRLGVSVDTRHKSLNSGRAQRGRVGGALRLSNQC
jgi:hypothetical protein